MSESVKNIVIIGNGMVGYKLCEKLVDNELNKKFKIIVFGEEPIPAYDRVHLTDYLCGKDLDELTLAKTNWYEENGIELYTGDKVQSIDRKNKYVISKSKKQFSYDKLILATGSSPFVPPLSGVDKDGVFVYRTIEDLDAIKSYSDKAKKAAVIGGGLLGLEAAKALVNLGLETHVLEIAERLMPRQLDEKASDLLKGKIEDMDIKIHLKQNIAQFSGNGKVDQILFDDKSPLEIDMIVISAGIKPRDELARECGLETAQRGGVVVNDRMETSDPDIYAIGEVASYDNTIFGLVAPGYEMAAVVCSNLTDKSMTFTNTDLSTKLKLIGVDVASFGNSLGTGITYRPIIFEDKVRGIYKKILVSVDGKNLLGGILIGDAAEYYQLLNLTKNEVILPPNPSELIVGTSGHGQNIEDLHDSAQICACENVTKGIIVAAIEDNELNDIAGIKSCTKAGTGCGGCSGLLTELLDSVMAKKGRLVKKVLCEHFSYTRQELLNIIKVKGIRKFDDLLKQYGKGEGCELCKPSIASMFSGAWNDKILAQQEIQDTNDKFLANIQIGGTYSIVPRIPGGEITPDGLIQLGEIAKKYDLYCKFTGGQRIDFFGAKLNDLPAIWEELGKHGFESGHAYAKGMRTVKSCAGSTWCHLGVQDSVTYCIEIETRYKGIRFPHKVKSAVSGCVRECAEAQSKDFGIIATENGWNLYVCGNGGIKPQHAVLLAADIDKETCNKYMDRFLMYYIKTAAHQTRTSTWFNSLEGGIDHLKSVIVEDSLGICSGLEKEMQEIVDNYHCEWAELVKDEEKKSRFRYFINSHEIDPTISFKKERNHKIPLLS